jgi:hypothetical protein
VTPLRERGAPHGVRSTADRNDGRTSDARQSVRSPTGVLLVVLPVDAPPALAEGDAGIRPKGGPVSEGEIRRY